MELKSTASCLPGRPAGSWAQAGGQVGRACCVPLNLVLLTEWTLGLASQHPTQACSAGQVHPQGESCLFQSCMCSFACMLASLVAF